MTRSMLAMALYAFGLLGCDKVRGIVGSGAGNHHVWQVEAVTPTDGTAGIDIVASLRSVYRVDMDSAGARIRVACERGALRAWIDDPYLGTRAGLRWDGRPYWPNPDSTLELFRTSRADRSRGLDYFYLPDPHQGGGYWPPNWRPFDSRAVPNDVSAFLGALLSSDTLVVFFTRLDYYVPAGSYSPAVTHTADSLVFTHTQELQYSVDTLSSRCPSARADFQALAAGGSAYFATRKHVESVARAIVGTRTIPGGWRMDSLSEDEEVTGEVAVAAGFRASIWIRGSGDRDTTFDHLAIIRDSAGVIRSALALPPIRLRRTGLEGWCFPKPERGTPGGERHFVLAYMLEDFRVVPASSARWLPPLPQPAESEGSLDRVWVRADAVVSTFDPNTASFVPDPRTRVCYSTRVYAWD